MMISECQATLQSDTKESRSVALDKMESVLLVSWRLTIHVHNNPYMFLQAKRLKFWHGFHKPCKPWFRGKVTLLRSGGNYHHGHGL